MSPDSSRSRGHEGDEAEAEALIDEISLIIDFETVLRLERWKERVATRGGAVRWLKAKLLGAHAAVAPSDNPFFTPAAAAKHFAAGLAERWNCGVTNWKELAGLATTFFFGGDRSIEFEIPPPPLNCRTSRPQRPAQCASSLSGCAVDE